MSISEKANDLLNKFGSAQFDFIFWNTLDNLVARDKARQKISDYIAELEEAKRELRAYMAEVEGLDEDFGSYDSLIPDWANKPKQRWIPVSERLPEPYTRVLACIKGGYMEVDYMYSEPIVDVGVADFNSLDNVTHWMPLPELPEVQE